MNENRRKESVLEEDALVDILLLLYVLFTSLVEDSEMIMNQTEERSLWNSTM
jgi:hypothetical protein